MPEHCTHCDCFVEKQCLCFCALSCHVWPDAWRPVLVNVAATVQPEMRPGPDSDASSCPSLPVQLQAKFRPVGNHRLRHWHLHLKSFNS